MPVPFDAVRPAAKAIAGLNNERVYPAPARLHPSTNARRTPANNDEATDPAHSTVTLFARLRGWSTSVPFSTAV